MLTRSGSNENSVQRKTTLDQSQDKTGMKEYSTNIQQ